MRDLYHNITGVVFNAKGPDRLGESGSVVADLRGYDAATAFIRVEGTGSTFSAANLVRFSLLHGDTSTAATAAVGVDDVFGDMTPSGGVVKTFNNFTSSAPGLFAVGYRGGRRYLRLAYEASGTATGATGFTGTRVGLGVLRGNPGQAPVA